MFFSSTTFFMSAKTSFKNFLVQSDRLGSHIWTKKSEDRMNTYSIWLWWDTSLHMTWTNLSTLVIVLRKLSYHFLIIIA